VSWYQRVKQNQFHCFDRTNEYFEEQGKAVWKNVQRDRDITRNVNYKIRFRNIPNKQ
jgi:hypothetical protein